MKHKSHFVIIVLSCAVVAFATSIFAQKPSPSASVQATKSFPFPTAEMGSMWSTMMNVMFAEATRPERATQLAHFQKIYYDALQNEGFTKEEALSIVKATQIPMTGFK